MRPMRALSHVAATLLLFAVFEACTSGDDTVTPPAGPPSLSVASISLGHGETGSGGAASTLVCDHTVGVTLTLVNWKLLPPGLCGQTPQCGQVRVSLLDTAGKELGSPEFAATVGVDLELDDLLDLSKLPALPATLSVQAELVNDAGDVFDASSGGNSTAKKSFVLSRIQDPGDCPELIVGGAGGAAGAASEGGAAGFGGMPDFGQAGLGGSVGEGGTGGAAGAND